VRGTWQTTGSGSGGLVLVVIAAVVLIGSGTASAAASALTSLLVTIAIIIGSVIALAILGGIAWLVYRARSDRPGRAIAAPVVSQLPPAGRPALEGSHNPAIEPAREIHLHLHGLTPDQVAAIVTQRGAYLEEDR
jgi:hypothetical protein